MRLQLALWLRWLADWLDPPSFAPTPTFLKALELARVWHDRRDVSGEFKRHQVYAGLIDAFPTTPRKELGYVLEQAVRTLP